MREFGLYIESDGKLIPGLNNENGLLSAKKMDIVLRFSKTRFRIKKKWKDVYIFVLTALCCRQQYKKIGGWYKII